MKWMRSTRTRISAKVREIVHGDLSRYLEVQRPANPSLVRRVLLGVRPASGTHGEVLTRVTKTDRNEEEINRNEILFEVTKAPEGGYDAQAVGHCIFTQGEDRDDLETMVQDAVRCHFAGGHIPSVRLHYMGDEAIAV